MKKRFTDGQIILMIKEQEAGEKTADVCRRHRISSATYYKYKSKYGGMEQSDGPNQRWSLEFVSDALTDGRRFRILTGWKEQRVLVATLSS